MLSFTNEFISIASTQHVDAIVALLNSAYRGEASLQGWTTEAHLIGGTIRTNTQQVLQLIQQPNSIFLIYINSENTVVGCVNLQVNEKGIYLGMFSVQPKQQGAGIGKQLLLAAEAFALQQKKHKIYMTVISVRKELIDWYVRNGYTVTNEIIPFIEDDVTGNHLQKLEFVVLEKLVI